MDKAGVTDSGPYTTLHNINQVHIVWKGGRKGAIAQRWDGAGEEDEEKEGGGKGGGLESHK